MKIATSPTLHRKLFEHNLTRHRLMLKVFGGIFLNPRAFAEWHSLIKKHHPNMSAEEAEVEAAVFCLTHPKHRPFLRFCRAVRGIAASVEFVLWVIVALLLALGVELHVR